MKDKVFVFTKRYARLIKEKKSPYYQTAKIIVEEMESYYRKKKECLSEIYPLRPWDLEKKLAEIVMEGEKLKSQGICRIIRALFHLAQLKEGKDFYSKDSSKGRKKYYLRLSKRTLKSLRKALSIKS